MAEAKQVGLAVVGLLYVGATAFLMYAAVAIGGTLSRTKWTDIFDVATASSSDSFLAYAIVTTCTGVLVACLRRHLPTTNNWAMTFVCMFVVFACVLAAMGFRSSLAAKNWSSAAFPFDIEEANVASTFHQAYCPTRVCAASTDPSLAALIQSTNASVSICSAIPSVHPATAASFDWVHTHCPMTSDMDAFCLGHLIGNTTNVTVKVDAPYQRCRPTLFVEWIRYANNVAGGSTALALSALVYLFVTSRSSPRPVVSRIRARKIKEVYVAAV